ncbi:MAG: stealth family protein [Tessaracoccus sp.]|uniref:stealth family protein n=1 Tax=Tessaracoccus sp. TaxID=1971211 RepID=UPI001EBB73E7|nr:stealth family protein [Tessaracoccus sp.]MBK7820142.1 stealth family protein [Tessaracoccus sp.]
MNVGFILTTPYQLFHYRAIAAHLSAEVTVYVELRDEDFSVSSDDILTQIPGCRIAWIESSRLASIDGECDVLVCQTPVAALQFFSRSLLVAQQYSLAKEAYQYGPWRAQASLNLMYGDYSTRLVSGYATAVAVGNPLFDGYVPDHGMPPPPAPSSQRLKLLYMPTYGDLSDRVSVLNALTGLDAEVAVKVHHADFEMRELAGERGLRVFLPDAHPAEVITQHDCIVSDYSGAIYDALALRKPVLLVDEINETSESLFRLSDGDRTRDSLAQLAAFWRPGDPVGGAYERSRGALADDDLYAAFVNRYFTNLGASGVACARAIEDLARGGDQADFGVVQVRETLRRYVTENRRLRAEAKVRRAKAGRSVRERIGFAIAQDTPRTLLAKVESRARRLAARALRRSGPSAVDASGAPDDGRRLSVVPRVRRAELDRLVRAAFDAHGIAYRGWSSPYTQILGVRADDADRVYRAVKGIALPADAELVVWTGAGAKYRPREGAAELLLSDFAASESVVVGARHPADVRKPDRTGGVEIALLEPRYGRLVARRHRLEKVDWSSDFGVADDGDVAPLAGPAAEEPVDIVYTWVDSDDAEWARERRRWSSEVEFDMPSAANDERYLARDELRYSIRSVWMYAPFVRNIHIVTNGQRPAWLPQDTDRIRVVPHSDIFPDPSVLPTFNSHAIEACLHRIPGLADRFLYFNDDVFLGREMRVDDFYTQAGMIKSRFSPSAFVTSGRPADDAIPTDWASYNAVTLMRREFGMTPTHKTKHVAHPLLRSMLEEMEQRYPEVFAQTRGSRFRAHTDYSVASMLAQYYAVATRRGVEWPGAALEYVYADTGRRDFPARLKLIAKQRPAFYCLNGTMYRDIDLATQARMMREFLEAQYPEASPYES